MPKAEKQHQDADPKADMAAAGFASIPEAQAYLAVSRSSIYQLMDTHQLAYARFGRSRRVPWAALRAYAAGCIVAG